ncbi:MAG: Unknown protein [uncultured Sulfurovum sp.]|uniref:Uncharacterized protein n=1 Tax=uncultured Sulfurovum sp. TaxID=269237 RepID=A0A6S6T5R1_9BACT|nr:MAG: Unknown protein [uncultured Sulfurovum sp.]
MMKKNSVTLNISHHTMSNNQWDILSSLYKTCRGWIGYSSDSIPYWFSMDENVKHINASAEMHGLVFDGLMEDDEWEKWLKEFISDSSDKLGFKVVDMED